MGIVSGIVGSCTLKVLIFSGSGKKGACHDGHESVPLTEPGRVRGRVSSSIEIDSGLERPGVRDWYGGKVTTFE